MAVEQTSIEAKGLTIEKNHKRILDDLNFVVKPGSITGLVGPSGSGKTTLMRTIVGVQKIHSGMLQVLDWQAGDSRLRHRIGYVTQAAAVYEDLTVLQNLRYFSILTRATSGQVDELIATLKLESQRHQLVSSLSGGQRARVSLGVALLGDPQLLVLDEPTVGLDPVLRQELWELFRQLALQGKTLFVSSHVMDEAEKCDDLLLLRDGKTVWNASRVALLQHTKTSSVGDAFIKIVTEEKR